MERRLRGHTETIREGMTRALEALVAATRRTLRRQRQAYDPCQLSVPGEIPHQRLLGAGGLRTQEGAGTWIRGPGEVIARHRRSYERNDFVFNPVHYLPLLEQKTGALD